MKRLPPKVLVEVFTHTAALGEKCDTIKMCSRQLYQIYHAEKLYAVSMKLWHHTLRAYHSHPDLSAYLPRLRHLTVNLDAHWYGKHGLKREESRSWRRSLGWRARESSTITTHG